MFPLTAATGESRPSRHPRLDIGIRGRLYTIRHGFSMAIAPPPTRPSARLFVVLEESDDVVDVLGIAQAPEWHVVALHLGLRVLDVIAQIGLVPGEVGARHRIRVAEIIERGGFAAEYALEARPDRVRLVAVACGAGLEHLLCRRRLR